jgi:AraC-like DNA-binding protein
VPVIDSPRVTDSGARRYAQRRGTGNAAILVSVGERHGIPSERSLRGTGIALADLADPQAEIVDDQELALVQNIVAAVPDIGVRAAKDVHSTAFGLLGLGLVSCETMRTALAFALRNFELSYTLGSFSVREGSAGLAATFDYPALSPAVERFLFARDSAVLVSIFRECVSPHVKCLSVTARAPRPSDTSDYEAALGVRPHFDMPTNTVTFESRVLDRALRMANPHTVSLCERLCQELIQRRRATDSLAKRVRHVISVLVARDGRPLPSQHDVAAALSVSTRSLRRELVREGTSFRELNNEVLIGLAREMLEAGARIDEIASSLGYSDNSAFSRGFKNATGISPSEYVHQSRHAEAPVARRTG